MQLFKNKTLLICINRMWGLYNTVFGIINKWEALGNNFWIALLGCLLKSRFMYRD